MLLFSEVLWRGVKEISTKMHRENSLILHGKGKILGILHCALKN